MNRILRDVSYTTAANAAALAVTAIVTLGVPKLLGVSEYGYFQLYLFYTSYVGFLHLGWIDGIYLRYGGVRYEDLDRQVLSGQFRLFSAIEVALGLLVCVAVVSLAPPSDRSTVLLMTGLCVVLHLPRTFFTYVLQSTGRVRDYSRNLLLDRGIFLLLVGVLLVLGARSFALLALADLVAKAIALGHAAWYCSDIVVSPATKMRLIVAEAAKNIGAGASLMFANIAGLLVIGLVRFGISSQWDVATFGKVSLTLSVSSLLMVFVGAVSMVLFPIVCRLSP